MTNIDFYFIRHGCTNWNTEKRLMGQIDIPLNDIGKMQAIDASIHASKLQFKTVFSSPLLRAKQTTQLLLDGSSNYFLDFSDDFKEINFGHHQGTSVQNLTISEIVSQKMDVIHGENLQQIIARIQNGLTILHQHPGPRLIVSHSCLYYILCQTLNLPYQDIPHCEIIHIKLGNFYL